MLGLGPDKNEVFILEYWDANKTREKVEIFSCGESKQRISILNATAPMPLNHSSEISEFSALLLLLLLLRTLVHGFSEFSGNLLNFQKIFKEKRQKNHWF